MWEVPHLPAGEQVRRGEEESAAQQLERVDVRRVPCHQTANTGSVAVSHSPFERVDVLEYLIE